MRTDASVTSDEGSRTLRSGSSVVACDARCSTSKGSVHTSGDPTLPEEGYRTLRSGSYYVPPHERPHRTSSSKRSVDTSGDSQKAVPAWALAASAAREDNQQLLRMKMEACLPYETGGMYPPARLCPRAIQAKAKKDAQAALALLLRTPVICPPSKAPAVVMPAVLPRLSETTVPGPNVQVWASPVGAYYRRQAAKQTHADGTADAPVEVFDDQDVEDAPSLSPQVHLHLKSNGAVVSPRVAGLSSSVLLPCTLVPDIPPPIVAATHLAVGSIPGIVPPSLEIPLQPNTDETSSSWSVHPMMAAAALYDTFQSGGKGTSSDGQD
jgi:hypothetical protein